MINHYYNLNKTIDKKSFNRTVFIGIPVSIVLFNVVAFLTFESRLNQIL